MHTSNPQSFYFLEGGGEMGELMRSFNWVNTIPGLPGNWPANLQQSVSLLLNSALPMCLLWGANQVGFYNDSFLPLIHHSDQPADFLARPASSWFHDDRLSGLVADVLTGNQDVVARDRNLAVVLPGLNPSTWSLSFTPVKSRQEVSGVLIIALQQTDEARTLLATHAHDEALSFTLDANELGSWNLDIATNNFTCNLKTREIFGLSDSESVDLAIAIASIYEPDRDRVTEAIRKVLANETPEGYNIDYIVQNPRNGQRRFVKARGKLDYNSCGVPVSLTGTLQDITVSKKLQETYQKLEHLIEFGADYMSVSNLDSGEINYLNQSGRALLNLNPNNDTFSYNISDFYDADQLLMYQAVILPALTEQQKWSGKVVLRQFLTNEEIPCYAHFIVLPDASTGEPSKLGITLRDLRRELEAGKQLEESEKRFRNLVELAPVATAIYLGRDMQIQLANDAMIALWGKTHSVIGKTVRDALPELEGQPFHQLLENVFTTGVMYQGKEDRADLVVDGMLQTYYFNFTYKALRDVDNEVYGILNMAVDVTEQVKAKQQLELSERNFRSLIMQAPIGICLLRGPEFRIDLVNDNYLDLVGKERNNFEFKNLWEVLPEAKNQGFDALLKEVLQSGKAFHGVEQPVELLRNGIPDTVYVNFVYEPLKNSDGIFEQVLVVATDVTSQVRSRLKVEDAEERARLAIESAKLGTFELSYTTGLMITSGRFDSIFGFDEPVTRDKYVSALHPDDMDEYKRAHKVAAETGQLQYKLRVRKSDTIHWVSVQAQVYYDRSAQPVKLLGIARDVTREMEDQQEREKFLSLALYSRDFIGMCDLEGNVLFVNKAGVDMVGLTEPDAFINTRLEDYLFPEDRRYVRETLMPHVLRDGFSETEIRFRNFNTGEAIWMIYSIFIIRDTRGVPSVIATVSRDITERKREQEELIKTSQRLEIALEAGSLGSYELDLTTGEMQCTEQCKKNFGLSSGSTLNFDTLLSLILPEDVQDFENALQTALRYHAMFTCEYRIRRQEGSIHWIKISGKISYNEKDDPERIVGVTLDITDRRNAQEELERRVRERTIELEKINNELQQFAYVSSHDLQEPLRKIQVFADLIPKHLLNESERVTGYLNKIASSAKRMSLLIHNLLEFSQLSDIRGQFEKTDLNAILENIKADFELLVSEKGAVIESEKLPVIEAIPFQMNQLFYNLISNALKFSSPDVRPLIQVKVREMSSEEVGENAKLIVGLKYYELFFIDNGIGFNQEYSEKIFTIFQRLSTRDTYAGTGIGLALCKKILSNHQGDISASSEPGFGAVFSLIMPEYQPKHS